MGSGRDGLFVIVPQCCSGGGIMKDSERITDSEKHPLERAANHRFAFWGARIRRIRSDVAFELGELGSAQREPHTHRCVVLCGHTSALATSPRRGLRLFPNRLTTRPRLARSSHRRCRTRRRRAGWPRRAVAPVAARTTWVDLSTTVDPMERPAHDRKIGSQ